MNAPPLIPEGGRIAGDLARRHGFSVDAVTHIGMVNLSTLPVVSQNGRPSRPPPAPTASSPPHDVLATLERLGALKMQGVLTDAEFNAKPPKPFSRLCHVVRLICIFHLFFLSSAAFSNEPPPTFKARGRILYEIFLPGYTNSSWVRNFTVTVRDCEWVIESVDTNGGNFVLNIRTNGLMYNVSAVNADKKTDQNNYFAVVEDNDVPPSSDTSGISVLWLAYASASYMQSVEGGQFKPVWMLDDPTLRAEGYTVSGIVDPLEGHLPRHLFYLDKGVRYARANGHRIILRAPASFHGAVTNARYDALTVTNLGGFQIPRTFEFQRFAVGPDYTTRLLARITGWTTSLEPAVPFDAQMPDLSGGILIVDKRFETTDTNVGVFTYHTTNQIFIAPTDPFFLKQKKLAKLNTAAKAHQ